MPVKKTDILPRWKDKDGKRKTRDVVFVGKDGVVDRRSLPSGSGYSAEQFSDLPQWVKLALAEYVSMGVSLKDAAERHDKSENTLKRYSCSPAGQKYKKDVAEYMDNPQRIAEMMLRASVQNTTLLYLQALDSAVASGDYREVGVISRDILDRMQIGKSKDASGSGKQQIIINLGALSIDPPLVSSSYKETTEEPHEANWSILEDSKDTT